MTRVKDLDRNTGTREGRTGGIQTTPGVLCATQTAYIVERVDRILGWMERMGLGLDEATVTGLETWHLLGQGFCPSVALVLPELWGRLTASFRGSTTSRWVWNQHKREESSDLAPDQTRLHLRLEMRVGIPHPQWDCGSHRPGGHETIGGFGSIILQSEQEGILEGEETLAMRALCLGTEEEFG